MSNNTVYSNPAPESYPYAPPPVQPNSNNLKKLHYLWLPLVWAMEYMIFACWWMTVAAWRMCVGAARVAMKMSFVLVLLLSFTGIGIIFLIGWVLAKFLGIGKKPAKPMPKPWAPWFASITK